MRTLNTSIIFTVIAFFTVVSSVSLQAQTSTVSPGNWNVAGNWTSGAPNAGSTATVNHPMTINTNISVGGNYTINQPVTDLPGGADYTLTVSGVLKMTAQGISVFEGDLEVTNGGSLIIEAGDTLVVGPNSSFANNSSVHIKTNGVLIITGDLKNDNNSTGITVDGTIIVLGDFKGWNGSKISGTGSIQTTGSLTYQGSGQTFGNNTPCNTGPCNTNQFCITNTVAANQSICSGAAPSGLTGNALSASYTYQWQQSTTSSYSGFINVPSGGTSQNYVPGALTTTTYYRRRVTNGTNCTVSSVPVTITVNPTSASVSISSNRGTTICSGTSVTFTATPTNGGTSPSYQWKVNGGNVGTNSAAYTTTTLTNGQTVTCVMTSTITCVSPSTATSNALTMSVNPANTWIGATSAAWTTASNWCGGAVPGASTNVVIPAGALNMPVISSTVNVRNITISASASVNVTAAGRLNVYGNFVNNGTYYDLGTTAFTGTTAQVKSGAADSLNNMVVSNANGLTINSPTYVKKYLTLTAGTVTTGGNLTVDCYYGAILGAGTGAISGNVTVVRTIWNDNWHYISSPLSGRSVADWNTTVPVKFGVNANLYSYDETNTTPNRDIGWTAIGSTATAIISMRGYSLYFPRYIYKTDFSMTGSYNHTQTYSITLTNTASGTPAADGWNLVGNPYPSELDWGAAGWTKTGLDNAIYFWDQRNNRYASYVGTTGTNGGSRYIPCMQGFYVKVTNPGTATLATTTNAVRTSVVNRDNWRESSGEPTIRLKASSGNLNDETVISLNNAATAVFDSQWDAYKLKNTGHTPNLYTRLADTDYSINSLPNVNQVIPVKLIVNVSGTYVIDAEISGLNTSSSIWLEDRLSGRTQDLIADPQYTVTLSAGDTTSRFYLHYENAPQGDVVTDNTHASGSAGISITSYLHNVSVTLPDQNSPATIYVCDAVGNKVYALEHAGNISGKIEFTLSGVSSGIYIVKVQTNNMTKTQQVFLSK